MCRRDLVSRTEGHLTERERRTSEHTQLAVKLNRATTSCTAFLTGSSPLSLASTSLLLLSLTYASQSLTSVSPPLSLIHI